MGNKITNWVKNQKVGNGLAKAVLLCLADKAFDFERGFVSMTQTQIAEIIEFDKRSVMRGLDLLESENIKLIRRIKTKKEDGTNNPNQYQILCPKEIFEHSDTQSPSQVTDSHYVGHQGDTQSLPKTVNLTENGEKQPDIVTDSHLEHSDTQSPSTVLKEEESLKKEKDISIEISQKRNFSNSEKAKRLFLFWQKRMKSKRSIFTKDRKAKAESILQKFSYPECVRAIVGCTKSDWHMGRDPNNQTLYNEFERIFKKPEETEKFIKRYYSWLVLIKTVATNGANNGNKTESNRTGNNIRQHKSGISTGQAYDPEDTRSVLARIGARPKI